MIHEASTRLLQQVETVGIGRRARGARSWRDAVERLLRVATRRPCMVAVLLSLNYSALLWGVGAMLAFRPAAFSSAAGDGPSAVR
jgi:hypothetical protein